MTFTGSLMKGVPLVVPIYTLLQSDGGSLGERPLSFNLEVSLIYSNALIR